MSQTKYKPKFGRVLIERKQAARIGSIILPENQRSRHAKCEGTILALGETAGWTETYDESGEKIVVQTLKVGDKVLFGRHAGAWLDATVDNKGELNDDGVNFICQDADILCVINEQQGEI